MRRRPSRHKGPVLTLAWGYAIAVLAYVPMIVGMLKDAFSALIVVKGPFSARNARQGVQPVRSAHSSARVKALSNQGSLASA